MNAGTCSRLHLHVSVPSQLFYTPWPEPPCVWVWPHQAVSRPRSFWSGLGNRQGGRCQHYCQTDGSYFPSLSMWMAVMCFSWCPVEQLTKLAQNQNKGLLWVRSAWWALVRVAWAGMHSARIISYDRLDHNKLEACKIGNKRWRGPRNDRMEWFGVRDISCCWFERFYMTLRKQGRQ